MSELAYEDIKIANDRIAGRIRPVVTVPADELSSGSYQVWLALEYMQHTGNFKLRGAQNFIQAHREAGTLPDVGIAIASGGNAAMACAWAARQQGVPATVFVPATAPKVKVDKLHAYGAQVHLVGREYAEAANACADFVRETGALASHAYDNPLIAAGAGTLLEEIRRQVPDLGTIVVAVGGGGLLAGVATAAHHYGAKTVGVEPEYCQSLHSAVQAGRLVDVTVSSVAADALGTRRVSQLALNATQRSGARSVIVPDSEIIRTRQMLWEDRRVVVEHGAATALAAITLASSTQYGYTPQAGEKVVVVLCGANTDLGSLLGDQ